MAIEELEKPHFKKCSHLCKSGCSIYPNRPQTCRQYECLWKSNAIRSGNRTRPDKLGVLFHATEIDDLKILELWETRPGAAQSEKCKELTRQLIEEMGFDDYQVVPAGQKPVSSMNMQMRFLKVGDEWTFQDLVSLDPAPTD